MTDRAFASGANPLLQGNNGHYKTATESYELLRKYDSNIYDWFSFTTKYRGFMDEIVYTNPISPPRFYIPNSMPNFLAPVYLKETNKGENKMKKLEFENKEEVYLSCQIDHNGFGSHCSVVNVIDSDGEDFLVNTHDLRKKPRFEFGEMILVSDCKNRDAAFLAKFAGYRPDTNEILAMAHYTNGTDSSVVNSWLYAWKLKEYDFVEVDGNKYYKDQVLQKL